MGNGLDLKEVCAVVVVEKVKNYRRADVAMYNKK